jgi:acetyltransferase
MLQDLVHHMTPEDVRLRFFTPLKELTHALAARLTQLDYDREMALVAEPPDGGYFHGVVRITADPENREAEYAIALRSDMKGRGLGFLLMQRILAIARARRIREVFGHVLRENEAMLHVCRDLGFALEPLPDEPDVVRVVKRLAE